MFHVVNAYTRAAQLEGLSAEASYRLQKVGGMVLEMVVMVWACAVATAMIVVTIMAASRTLVAAREPAEII